jgi:hypothetical protein
MFIKISQMFIKTAVSAAALSRAIVGRASRMSAAVGDDAAKLQARTSTQATRIKNNLAEGNYTLQESKNMAADPNAINLAKGSSQGQRYNNLVDKATTPGVADGDSKRKLYSANSVKKNNMKNNLDPAFAGIDGSAAPKAAPAPLASENRAEKAKNFFKKNKAAIIAGGTAGAVGGMVIGSMGNSNENQ